MRTLAVSTFAALATLSLDCQDAGGVGPVSSEPLNGRIIFASEGGGAEFTNGVWSLNFPGGEIQLLSAGGSDVRVSADSRLIVFTKLSPQHSQDIYRLGPGTYPEFNLTNRPQVSEFFPDVSSGAAIAFSALYASTGSTSICIVDSGGTSITSLTDTANPSSQAWFPRWSPDGRDIAYVHRTQPGALPVYALALMHYDGSAQHDVVPMYAGTVPVWSPDGRYIAYASISLQLSALAVLDVQTGTSRVLTMPGFTFIAGGCAWSPRGELYCLGKSESDSLWDVFRVSAPMISTPVRISSGYTASSDLLCPSAGTSVLVLGRKYGDGLSLYILDLQSGEEKRVKEIASQAVVEYGGCVQWMDY